jgi:predicted PurR-regulated permease PerM
MVAGVFFAARPALYKQGFLLLFPANRHQMVAGALDESAHALRRWLLGKFAAMVIVGVATTLGLFAIGMPSALGLGFLAGLFEFIPFVGPFFSAAPAVALALNGEENLDFWVIGLYLVIQQIENNLIIPWLLKRTVRVPPVLALFAIVIFSTVFGPIGLLMAEPLTVLALVLIRRLYIEGALGRSADRAQRMPADAADQTSSRQENSGA